MVAYILATLLLLLNHSLVYIQDLLFHRGCKGMITLFYLLKEESEICHVIITVTLFLTHVCYHLTLRQLIGNQFAFQNTGTIMMMWQNVNYDK